MNSLRLTLISLLSFLLAPATQAAEFAVSPMLIEMTGAPNTAQDFEFSIHGKTDGTAKFTIYSLSQQESGHLDFVAMTTDEGMPAWIELERNGVTVREGETQTVKGKISVPRKASGTHLAAIMVEEEKEDDQQGGVAVTVRYAIVLTLDLGGQVYARSSTEFNELKISVVKDQLVVSGLFANNGSLEQALQSEVQLRDENNRLLERVSLKTQSAWQRNDELSRVFPGSKVLVYGVIQKPISSNVINAVVRNKFGGRTQSPIRASLPTPQLAKLNSDDAKADINQIAAPVLMEMRGKNRAFGKVPLFNPTGEPITIIFPEANTNTNGSFRFSPDKVVLSPGQKRFALLTQNMDQITDEPLAYEAKIEGKADQKSITITAQINNTL